MMFFFLSLFAFGVRATDICLPLTHSAHVHTTRWALGGQGEHQSHRYDEYREGDHFYVWVDGTSQKMLVHVYEGEIFDGKYSKHDKFILRDYRLKYKWTADFEGGQLSHCQLELMDKVLAPYCVVKGAVLKGSGTVGQGAKIDFYEAQFDDPDRQYHEEIEILTEAGNPSLMIQERIHGTHFNQTEQRLWEWDEHREWFDINEAKIDPTIFAVPVGCPQ